GEPLNPGSPKQLGDILFGKFGLPGGTKTKTGAWSTGARALEDLAEAGHELPRKILDWRQVSKLRSTYTDALPDYVNAETHRVHTSYALAATTTGRLSSSEPNLQHIPIRTEEGSTIRRAFIPEQAPQLIIGLEEAGVYIKKYFERFPCIRDYMEETKAYAKKHGYVLTLFGRKCHYPDITAANASLRAFNERAAINARLQGSAADIIRRAMIRIEPALSKSTLKAKMLLQVHDELIFEVPEGEVAKTLPL